MVEANALGLKVVNAFHCSVVSITGPDARKKNYANE
jgi:hypothetical protein